MNNKSIITMPKHGGNLEWAAEYFNIPKEQWVDLSSAVSPWPYRYADINKEAIQALPYISTGFYQKASSYYGVDKQSILPLNGSQEAIAFLPLFYALTKGAAKVLLPKIGYEEHRHHWQLAKHKTYFYTDEKSIDKLIADESIKVCVLINPNNPTGETFLKEKMHEWRQKLQERGGWLIIDEAFIDVWPERSMLSKEMPKGLIVLRSAGKFFGLPGLRLGFLFSQELFASQMQKHIGLWNVSAHTLAVAEQFLIDKCWQKNQQIKIIQYSNSLYKKITNILIKLADEITNNGLFISFLLSAKQSVKLFNYMGEKAFLIRCYPENNNKVWVRLALPENDSIEKKLIELLRNFAVNELSHHSNSSPLK